MSDLSEDVVFLSCYLPNCSQVDGVARLCPPIKSNARPHCSSNFLMNYLSDLVEIVDIFVSHCVGRIRAASLENDQLKFLNGFATLF